MEMAEKNGHWEFVRRSPSLLCTRHSLLGCCSRIDLDMIYVRILCYIKCNVPSHQHDCSVHSVFAGSDLFIYNVTEHSGSSIALRLCNRERGKQLSGVHKFYTASCVSCTSSVHPPDSICSYITNPPLANCLGSPAASKVPLLSRLSDCAVDCPGATHVTLCPLAFMKATVSLSYAYSKLTKFGTS